MAGTIKGITIEIDGNTSGLQEALKDVNKNINGLGSELKAVDKLLKLDPSNTTILAQKQELLKKAIAETSDKLKVLKDSQEQVEKAFKNGDIGEEQYRAFEREVAKAENSLNGFERELKQVETQAKGTDNDLNKMNNELSETNRKSKDFDAEGFKNKVSGMGATAVATATVILGAITVAVGSIAKLSTETIQKIDEVIKKSGEYADEIITLANVTNLDTGTLQGWGYASRFIDTEVDTIAKSIAKMTNGLNTNEATFESLGVTLKNTNGTYRTQQEIFLDTIDALGKIDDETQRDAISMQLFGKSAQELNPLIKAGGEELAKMSEEAEKLGLILSDKQLTDLGRFDDMMQDLEAISISFGQHIALAFLPIAEAIYNPFKEGFGKVNQTLADGIQEGDIDKVKEIVRTTFENIKTNIEANLPEIKKNISEGLKFAIDVLADILPDILDLGLEIIQELTNALNDALQDAETQKNLNEIFKTLSIFLKESIDQNGAIFAELGFTILKSMLTGFEEGAESGEGFTILDLTIFGWIEKMGSWILVPMLENGKNMASSFISGFVDSMIQDLSILLVAFDFMIQNIKMAISNGIVNMWQYGSQIVTDIVNGISGSIQNAINAGSNLIENIKIAINNGLNGLYAIGFNVVSGIWDGISGGYGWIINKISGWVDNVVTYIKKAFKINSPSKLMKDEVGLMIGYGVADGIFASLPKVQSAMGYITDKVTTSVNPIINPSLTLAGAGNSTTVNPVINITVQGNADQSTIDYLLTELNKKMGGLV